MPDDNVTFPVSNAAVELLAKKQAPPTSIYDPKARTPLPFKAPEIEMCPHCGQQMPSKVTQLNTTMNNYINVIGVRVAQMNSEDVITIKGVPYYRVTSQVGDKYISAFMPVPDNIKVEAPITKDQIPVVVVTPPATPAPTPVVVNVPPTPTLVQTTLGISTPVPEQTLAQKVAASAAQHAASN
jgi:hypothetical protein